MPLNDAALDIMAEALVAVTEGVSFHNGDPGPLGTANVIAGGRLAIDLESTNGDITLAAPATKSGLTPLEDVDYLGFWTTSITGGTYLGSSQRASGDAAVNAAGEYTINSLSIPGSSS